MCEQNAILLSTTAGDIYSYIWALNGWAKASSKCNNSFQMFLGKWPTWRTNSFVCVYFHL